MNLSPVVAGSHATPCPLGRYTASINPAPTSSTTTSSGACTLRISATTNPAQRYSTIQISPRIQVREVCGLRWNASGNLIAVLTPKIVEIVDLDDASRRIRLDNGSGGYGKFADLEFVGQDGEGVIVVWEFGKVKFWDLRSGRGVEVGEVKCAGAEGRRWHVRPGEDGRMLVMLGRQGAEDVLSFYAFGGDGGGGGVRCFKIVKLLTVDAQGVEWSPDGRWICVRDVGTATQGVHFLTADGCCFRSWQAPEHGDASSGLGVKEVVWAGGGRIVALTGYDGRITLLNTRTFAALAMVEHANTIKQKHSTEAERQAVIWQEAVSASNDRSYTAVTQPFSPPLSRSKPSTDPAELGIAEACFSANGNWLATREERMLNTVWIWDMATLSAHAVLVQHNNSKKLHWHPRRDGELLMDCGEGIAYLFEPELDGPPTALTLGMSGITMLSWLNGPVESKSAIISTAKSSFRLLHPEGQPEDLEAIPGAYHSEADATILEDPSEDSLFDVLSGRKPLPPKTEQSYTERVDLEVEEEEGGNSVGLEDTFREKVRRPKGKEVDPLDDSEIF